VFKPAEVLDFYAEPVEREWDKDKLAKLNQLNLFETTQEVKFEVVQKLPYKFKFRILDNQGKESGARIGSFRAIQIYSMRTLFRGQHFTFAKLLVPFCFFSTNFSHWLVQFQINLTAGVV
jgi:hypothetical protein